MHKVGFEVSPLRGGGGVLRIQCLAVEWTHGE